MFTDFNALHPENALESIDETVVGIDMDDNLMQLENA